MIEMRSKCPKCRTERLLWGPFKYDTIADLDAAETLIDIKGKARAICPTCDVVEEVALFADGKQTEPWMDADEYEHLNGPNAGPLPPKPDLDQ